MNVFAAGGIWIGWNQHGRKWDEWCDVMTTVHFSFLFHRWYTICGLGGKGGGTMNIGLEYKGVVWWLSCVFGFMTFYFSIWGGGRVSIGF